jgi:hypothetical protein
MPLWSQMPRQCQMPHRPTPPRRRGIHRLVMSGLGVPPSVPEALQPAFDLDGDGDLENASGNTQAAMSSQRGFALHGQAAEAIAQGRLIQLIQIHAESLVDQAEVMGSFGVGDTPHHIAYSYTLDDSSELNPSAPPGLQCCAA